MRKFTYPIIAIICIAVTVLFMSFKREVSGDTNGFVIVSYNNLKDISITKDFKHTQHIRLERGNEEWIDAYNEKLTEIFNNLKTEGYVLASTYTFNSNNGGTAYANYIFEKKQ